MNNVIDYKNVLIKLRGELEEGVVINKHLQMIDKLVEWFNVDMAKSNE